MERVVPGAHAAARRQADLVGTPVFWLTIAVTLCALVPLAVFPRMRAWLGCVILLMWACFFTANAVRSGVGVGVGGGRRLDGVGARRRHHRREPVRAVCREVPLGMGL
jgi:hypothetical protein